MKTLVALSIVLFAATSFAQTPDGEVSDDAPIKPREEKPVELGRSKDEVATEEKKSPVDFSLGEKDLSVGYSGSLIGLAIPFKHGPLIAYRFDKWALEAQYFGGELGLDLSWISVASVKENLWIVQGRRFVGKSFNWIIGLSQQTYEAKVGQQIIGNTTGAPTSAEVLKVRTVGAQVGFGNRWQMENGFMFGADWLVLNFPFMTLETDISILQYVNNQDTANKVEEAVKWLKYFPTGAIAKIHVGYSF